VDKIPTDFTKNRSLIVFLSHFNASRIVSSAVDEVTGGLLAYYVLARIARLELSAVAKDALRLRAVLRLRRAGFLIVRTVQSLYSKYQYFG
jgi:hypothetical protein